VPDVGRRERNEMKRFIFVIIFILSVGVSYFIWDNSRE
jgi:hypothetical protein